VAVFYLPPYDSPIEDRFVFHFENYAATDLELFPQVQVETLCGRFVLDFVARTPSGYRVGIECDGRDYHDPGRDEWRDAMILGDEHVDALYRIRGSDIHHVIHDVLFLMATFDSVLFLPRAPAKLAVEASDEAKRLALSDEKEQYFAHYSNSSDIGNLDLVVRRRAVPSGQRRFWASAYRHAKKLGGGQLDEVRARFPEGLRDNDEDWPWCVSK
jgi:hypothetical protein